MMTAMQDTLNQVRRGLQEEITRLQNEATRLSGILAQLGGGDQAASMPVKRGPGRPRRVEVGSGAAAAAAPADGRRRRGRPKGSKNLKSSAASPSAVDLEAALRKIEEAGKLGIGARALQVALKKDGVAKPSKGDLLATQKVKTKGVGGATSYVWNE
jgi:hypothetical protein